ncbi:NAD(P)H-binding protein [Nocardia paucivorans]|uniref:NAD(P)H-binding protein n=1 Tax=Nocardia paucivorans TaxID=114259 RepID=UPI0002E15965|nr:NAD(P)H-binding protein [Nocardia paucivorans]
MIVVTGATGNVGRPLVQALVAAGEQVTAVSRTASPGVDPDGVRRVRADLVEPEGWKSVLDGAKALFLLTSGDFSGAGGDLSGVLDLARDRAVARVVLLSSQGVGTGRHPGDYEQAVQNSGLPWTILRPGAFHSNALMWAEAVRVQRAIAAPFGDIALPAIDPADIAEVAAVALTASGHEGATYELTGPEAISPRQQAAVLAEVLGEPIRFVELSRAQARAHMIRTMPEAVVEATLDILGAPTERERRVSPDVERVLGRSARPFAEWARRGIAAFR